MTHPLQPPSSSSGNTAAIRPRKAPTTVAAVDFVLAELDAGKLRVAEKIDGEWFTHQWLKKAVLLSFRLRDNRVQDGGALRYWDKVVTKFEV